MKNKTKYLYDRYKEYCNARGIDYNSNERIQESDKDFINWLIEYNELLRQYLNHLSLNNNVTSNYYHYFECDKGYNNSIADEEYMISEFSHTPSKLYLAKKDFYIVSTQSVKLVQPDYKFLTFNPSNEQRFTDFIKLHNDGNPVIFSVIGDNSDEDREKKIEDFNRTLEYLDGNYGIEVDTYEDKYFYTFYSSNQKRKSHVKQKIKL